MRTQPEAIAFPHPEPPEFGTISAVAEGILWVRLPLPFQLNHVNIYLIEDEGGWAAFDTGLGVDTNRAAWEALLAGPLHGRRLTRIICSHFHPDHMGLAGWLTQRFGCPLSMTRTDYLVNAITGRDQYRIEAAFFSDRGMNPDAAEKLAQGEGHRYLQLVTGTPGQFTRLLAGDSLRIGAREFQILTGGGHAPEQAMLYCAADTLFLAADQVLTRISPNISVVPIEPYSDPLGDYLTSLAAIRASIPADVLVLPGHHVPFTGLHLRIDELAHHHAVRCDQIATACRTKPHSIADLVPVLFKRDMDPHQTGFAFAEVLAHVNYMDKRGDVIHTLDPDGIWRARAGAHGRAT